MITADYSSVQAIGKLQIGQACIQSCKLKVPTEYYSMDSEIYATQLFYKSYKNNRCFQLCTQSLQRKISKMNNNASTETENKNIEL